MHVESFGGQSNYPSVGQTEELEYLGKIPLANNRLNEIARKFMPPILCISSGLVVFWA